MPIKRLTVLSVLSAALFATGPLLASSAPAPSVIVNVDTQLMNQLPAFNPAPVLSASAITSALLPAGATAPKLAYATRAKHADDDAGNAMDAAGDDVNDLRKTLIGLAMNLRDIRYVRGGHDPSTGFDCSGFVRYVFAHAIGFNLPTNSASQFLSGLKVRRDDMRPGDLVFFRTAGRHGGGRISHVGIYVADGRFIHSPSRGKTVRVDSLDESYWAKRFAGAKRPEAIAQNG